MEVSAMGSNIHQVGLDDEEMKTLIEILKYSVDSCPIESISQEINITSDKVEDLVTKPGKGIKVRISKKSNWAGPNMLKANRNVRR